MTLAPPTQRTDAVRWHDAAAGASLAYVLGALMLTAMVGSASQAVGPGPVVYAAGVMSIGVVPSLGVGALSFFALRRIRHLPPIVAALAGATILGVAAAVVATAWSIIFDSGSPAVAYIAITVTFWCAFFGWLLAVAVSRSARSRRSAWILIGVLAVGSAVIATVSLLSHGG